MPFRLPLKDLSRLAFVFFCLWSVIIVVETQVIHAQLRKASGITLPFGVYRLADNQMVTQDFAYNLLYFRGIRDRLVDRPYRLDNQEKIMRQYIPQASTGMAHAYSPVALALALPLTFLPGAWAYLAYTIICCTGGLLLYYFFLLPEAKSKIQIIALMICGTSVCLMHGFIMGQSTLLTTPVIGAMWALLRSPDESRPFWKDAALGILFWVVCLKPNVAPIAVVLLLGTKAWRAFLIGFVLLVVTWACLGPFYGGWLTGLTDYSYLLNHYSEREFTPFMKRAPAVVYNLHSEYLFLTAAQWFAIYRNLFLAFSVVLLFLKWTGRIRTSEFFQGIIWNFLLFSPYLLTTEDWIVCLIIVEGVFFRPASIHVGIAKLLLLIGLLDLRIGLTCSFNPEGTLKWLLFLWIVGEGIYRWRKTRAGDPSVIPTAGHASDA